MRTFEVDAGEQYVRFIRQLGIEPNVILASDEMIKAFDDLAHDRCTSAYVPITEPQRVYNNMQVIRADVPGLIVARIQE